VIEVALAVAETVPTKVVPDQTFTVWLISGLPPSELGSDHLTFAEREPAVAVTPEGAVGAVAVGAVEADQPVGLLKSNLFVVAVGTAPIAPALVAASKSAAT
jgi:hypothetical protein